MAEQDDRARSISDASGKSAVNAAIKKEGRIGLGFVPPVRLT